MVGIMFFLVTFVQTIESLRLDEALNGLSLNFHVSMSFSFLLSFG
jgi:hypothetical protein